MSHEQAAELLGVSKRSVGNLIERFLTWAQKRDPQLDAQVRGISLFRIEGGTQMTGTAPEGPLRIAMFWSPQDPRVQDPEQLAEQVGTSTPLALPSNYVLNFFELPGREHMLRRPDGSEAGYTVGRVLVYTDD